MKTFKIAASIAALTVFAAPALVHAQDAALLEKAKQSCTRDAEAKGYKLDSIGSTEAIADGGVKVRLNLTKVSDGTKAPLTCTLSKDGKVAIGDLGTMSAPEVTTPGISPWLWALLPIIGLPLLLGWARGRHTEVVEPVRRVATTGAYERQEATIRANSDNLDIYSGPGTSYRVNGSLRNGQRVILTGRYDNNWAELESGGWIPAQYLEGATRYVR